MYEYFLEPHIVVKFIAGTRLLVIFQSMFIILFFFLTVKKRQKEKKDERKVEMVPA